jgi:hypothetical protein
MPISFQCTYILGIHTRCCSWLRPAEDRRLYQPCCLLPCRHPCGLRLRLRLPSQRNGTRSCITVLIYSIIFWNRLLSTVFLLPISVGVVLGTEQGLWLGILFGLVVQMLLLLSIILSTNWNNQVSICNSGASIIHLIVVLFSLLPIIWTALVLNSGIEGEG